VTATTRLFASTTVDALNSEIDGLIERVLADDTNTCPECDGLHLAPLPNATTADDSADLFGIALLRADGAWRLVVDVVGDRLVAYVTDGRPDPVAAGAGGSLGVVLDAVREQLGAAVREAVATP
jgi:hypothetical protein